MIHKKNGEVGKCWIIYDFVAHVKDLGFSLIAKSLSNLNNFYLTINTHGKVHISI